MVIWKFPIPEDDEPAVIEMPRGAKVLTVQMQGRQPCLWAMVDPDAPTEPRTFHVVGTGQPVPKDCPYIGTFQYDIYVWHVFEG